MSEAAQTTRRRARRTYEADPIREAEAVRILRQNLAILDSDDELLMGMIEGETTFFECLDALLLDEAEITGLVAGVDEAIVTLKGRKDRFEKRRESRRGLIEQMLLVAQVDVAIERPLATLSLARRPAQLVIETEADIPAEYWKTPEPVLDRKALLAALNERAKQIAALPEDPTDRAEAIAALPSAIPGATLSNAAPSLTIRSR